MHTHTDNDKTTTDSGRPAFTAGDRIRKARIGAGMSQGDLARAIGAASATVCRAETNARPPSRRTLIAVAVVTGVAVDWLAGDEAAA